MTASAIASGPSPVKSSPTGAKMGSLRSATLSLSATVACLMGYSRHTFLVPIPTQPSERGRKTSGLRVQGETKADSPCAIFAQQNGRAARCRPSVHCLLGRFLGLGDGLRLLLRLGFGSELLLHLERDGVRIHFVGLRGGAEDFAVGRRRFPRGKRLRPRQ